MRKPYWKAQTRHWYVKVQGKPVRLTDEPCPKTKNPPPAVERAWRELDTDAPVADPKFSEVVADYLLTATGEHHSKTASFVLTKFQESVGPVKASALRPFHLTKFFAAHPTWGPATKRTYSNRVHAALNYAVKQGRLPKNPIASTPGYKREGYYTKKKGTVTPDLRERLEAAASPYLRRVLVALRESGCRPGEIRRVAVERCFPDNGVMYVPNKTERQTGEAERAVYLTSAMVELVKEAIGSRTTGPVFLTKQRKAWSYGNLEGRWYELAKKVGVPKGITLYSYRRSFATAAINERDVNPALVAQLMGHNNLQMLLKHYAQEDPEALRKAVEQITKQP